MPPRPHRRRARRADAHRQAHGYYRALAAASPRLQVEVIGNTEEGRDLLHRAHELLPPEFRDGRGYNYGSASNNSLVRSAPSQGLVSRAGIIAISYTQDRAGVHARSVADGALVLSVIRGFDAEDLFAWESLGKLRPNPYTDYLDKNGLVGARLGVFRDLFRDGPPFAGINALVEKEIDFMRTRGAVIVDGLRTGMDLVKFFPLARASV